MIKKEESNLQIVIDSLKLNGIDKSQILLLGKDILGFINKQSIDSLLSTAIIIKLGLVHNFTFNTTAIIKSFNTKYSSNYILNLIRYYTNKQEHKDQKYKKFSSNLMTKDNLEKGSNEITDIIGGSTLIKHIICYVIYITKNN